MSSLEMVICIRSPRKKWRFCGFGQAYSSFLQFDSFPADLPSKQENPWKRGTQGLIMLNPVRSQNIWNSLWFISRLWYGILSSSLKMKPWCKPKQHTEYGGRLFPITSWYASCRCTFLQGILAFQTNMAAARTGQTRLSLVFRDTSFLGAGENLLSGSRIRAR